MSKIDVTYYKVRSAQLSYNRLVEQTLNWLSDRLHPECFLSWSAGKDSMVMVSLCRRIRPGLPILCSDTGVPYRWSAEDRDIFTTWTGNHGWNVRYFPWDKWGTTTAASAEGEREYRKAVHAGQFDELDTWATQNGYTTRVDGMRMEESRPRKILLAKGRGITQNGLHPLWNWSTDDVWTYTIQQSLPWLSIYDHLGPTARNGLIGRNGATHGRLAYLRRFYPEAFQRACELFNAREYV